MSFSCYLVSFLYPSTYKTRKQRFIIYLSYVRNVMRFGTEKNDLHNLMLSLKYRLQYCGLIQEEISMEENKCEKCGTTMVSF